VTGAARGIGERIAEVLVENGARVASLDLQQTETEGILGIECDVSDEGAVNAAFDEVERSLGTASVLVLNAGILASVPFEQTSTELWDRTLAINLTGAFYVVRRALPAMRADRYGRVIGLGAAAGNSGGARSAAYAASKAGLMTLVKSIAIEYARDGSRPTSSPRR
jgi:NAD(P)-dependent dehydrogenase (short-subunit alcohol dehydrogenase family)